MNSDADERATTPSAIAAGEASAQEQLLADQSRWPQLTPCEAASHMGGTPIGARIEQLFSGRVGVSERVVSWAELTTDQESIWTVFDGGYIEGEESATAVSCGIGLERGLDVVFFDRGFDFDEEAEAIRPGRNSFGRIHPDGSLELVYGVLRPEDVTEFLQEFEILAEQPDACPFEFQSPH